MIKRVRSSALVLNQNMLEILRGAAEKAGFTGWDQLQKALANLPPPSHQTTAVGDSSSKATKEPKTKAKTKANKKPKAK